MICSLVALDYPLLMNNKLVKKLQTNIANILNNKKGNKWTKPKSNFENDTFYCFLSKLVSTRYVSIKLYCI